jgi:asparagine synthase (glutamine-hydrolysing)
MFRDILSDSQCVLGRVLHPDTVQLLLSGGNITWYGQLMGRPQLIAWLIQLENWFREYNVKIV